MVVGVSLWGKNGVGSLRLEHTKQMHGNVAYSSYIVMELYLRIDLLGRLYQTTVPGTADHYSTPI